jgi:hypothetical protein
MKSASRAAIFLGIAWEAAKIFVCEGVWLDVPATALTIPADNPIDVATVWYSITGDGPEGIFIRCFVPESEA